MTDALNHAGGDATDWKIFTTDRTGTHTIEVFWDSPHDPGGDLRVIASIDDGRFLSALSPLSAGFMMDPDGEFVGE